MTEIKHQSPYAINHFNNKIDSTAQNDHTRPYTTMCAIKQCDLRNNPAMNVRCFSIIYISNKCCVANSVLFIVFFLFSFVIWIHFTPITNSDDEIFKFFRSIFILLFYYEMKLFILRYISKSFVENKLKPWKNYN